MNTTAQLLHRVNDFFETYARAMENHDTKLMAYHYNIPCTFISDDATTLFTEGSKLEGLFHQGTTYYKQHGIVKMRAAVWSKHEWTDKIIKAKVNWQYLEANNKPAYNCDYHYVLKVDKNNHLKIILSASVNEKERMEAWQKSR